jgi:hypothetical protein
VSACIAGVARRSAEKHPATQFLDIFFSFRVGGMHSARATLKSCLPNDHDLLCVCPLR